MSIKRTGLGRNLSALLSTNELTQALNEPATTTGPAQILDLSCLQPGKYQPRAAMSHDTLHELADSIKRHGLLQPILVRRLKTGEYEIIAGERRWRACQLAGLTQAPVIVQDVDDETAMAMALIENLQREDLNAMDQARAMYRLTQEFSLTHQQIAALLGKSRAAVSNYLRLLHLHSEVRHLLENGDLDMGHARCLLMLDEAMQVHVAHLVVAKGLSVRETEALVTRVKTEKKPREPQPDLSHQFMQQLQILTAQLQAPIKIKTHAKGHGSLVIHYDNAHALENLMKKLTMETVS